MGARDRGGAGGGLCGAGSHAGAVRPGVSATGATGPGLGTCVAGRDTACGWASGLCGHDTACHARCCFAVERAAPVSCLGAAQCPTACRGARTCSCLLVEPRLVFPTANRQDAHRHGDLLRLRLHPSVHVQMRCSTLRNGASVLPRCRAREYSRSAGSSCRNCRGSTSGSRSSSTLPRLLQQGQATVRRRQGWQEKRRRECLARQRRPPWRRLWVPRCRRRRGRRARCWRG